MKGEVRCRIDLEVGLLALQTPDDAYVFAGELVDAVHYATGDQIIASKILSNAVDVDPVKWPIWVAGIHNSLCD